MVMEVHDEAMPQMGALAQLTAQIKAQRDLDTTDIDLAESMKDLQEAHTLMMDWMKGFGAQFTADEIMKGAPLSPEKKVLLSDEFDYGGIDSLKHFEGSHPQVMQSRIAAMDWQFDIDPTQKNFGLKAGLLHWIEKLSGWRVGEYKNFIRIR